MDRLRQRADFLAVANGMRVNAGALTLQGRSREAVALTPPPGLPYKPHATATGEKTREADLSTQQTGAQAPSRLPRPSRHRRRSQGSRRPPCARPQASERLSRIFRRFHSWIG